MIEVDIKDIRGLRGWINLAYLKANPSSSIEKLGYVSAQTYVIATDDHELITNGMGACSALGFSTQGKIFLAHVPKNSGSKISKMIDRIKTEFDTTKFATENVKIKVFLGTTTQNTDSVNTILKTLYEINLLNRFLQKLHQSIRNNIENIISHSSITRLEIYKVLAFDKINNAVDIEFIATMINKMKGAFLNLKETVLTQDPSIGGESKLDDAFSSTKDTQKLPLISAYQCNNASDVLTQLNIILEKYYLRRLPGQHKTLFSSKPKHSDIALNLQIQINELGKQGLSEAELYKRLEILTEPFCSNSKICGEVLSAAIRSIEKPNAQFLPFNTNP